MLDDWLEVEGSLFVTTLLSGSDFARSVIDRDGSEEPNTSTVKESIGSSISESEAGLSLSDVGAEVEEPPWGWTLFRFRAGPSWRSDALRLRALAFAANEINVCGDIKLPTDWSSLTIPQTHVRRNPFPWGVGFLNLKMFQKLILLEVLHHRQQTKFALVQQDLIPCLMTLYAEARVAVDDFEHYLDYGAVSAS
jgi:hypothetical protein